MTDTNPPVGEDSMHPNRLSAPEPSVWERLKVAQQERDQLQADKDRLSRIVEVLRTEAPVYHEPEFVEPGLPCMPGGWQIGPTGGNDLIEAAEAWIALTDAATQGGTDG